MAVGQKLDEPVIRRRVRGDIGNVKPMEIWGLAGLARLEWLMVAEVASYIMPKTGLGEVEVGSSNDQCASLFRGIIDILCGVSRPYEVPAVSASNAPNMPY